MGAGQTGLLAEFVLDGLKKKKEEEHIIDHMSLYTRKHTEIQEIYSSRLGVWHLCLPPVIRVNVCRETNKRNEMRGTHTPANAVGRRMGPAARLDTLLVST